jgi:hypothetical protein
MVGLMQSGASADTIRDMLVSSQEFYNDGGGTNSGYVQLLYQRTLGRAADTGGATYWTAALNAGLPRYVAASMFVTSSESRSNLVSSWYTTYLLRSADSGLSYWVGRLNAGVAETQVLTIFLTTPEYFTVHGIS